MRRQNVQHAHAERLFLVLLAPYAAGVYMSGVKAPYVPLKAHTPANRRGPPRRSG